MKNLKFTLSLVLIQVFSFGMIACSQANNKEEAIETSIEEINYDGPTELATFAGGCFWCIEAPFEGIQGVVSVVSGYAGGKEKNPTYADVSGGKTSHKEAVQITYNPEVISYSELLDIFWQQFDPTDAGGSFYDRGTQYESAIFYHSNIQKQVAEESKKRLGKSGKFDKPIVTPIVKFSNFYEAEAYHQDYYKKNPEEYHAYRRGSGRDAFIAKYWPTNLENKYKSPSREELKKILEPLQYEVAINNETEIAFNNKYNENKEDGIYVCIVSGAPLFSSKDKYESYSGWPSFTKPIDARLIDKPLDYEYGMVRVEVRSKLGDSHLGHVFFDGPKPTQLRYCMNSAAMRFISKNDMEAEGYTDYLWLVD
ncbi:peptide-methionine (S)-S-oxide reductase MsrA [Belliella pelovolcani]|uniref:peptide-methionine (S)-S-oxide reductase MsrA n=1 Tax=Belliella pelovolcani TaxID=529505 RepID=UPI003919D0EA